MQATIQQQVDLEEQVLKSAYKDELFLIPKRSSQGKRKQ
jgi:hypothetical protein